MKRRLITCMAFLCAIIGTSKGTDYVTGGDGLSISENFIVNRGSSGNVREIWSNNAKMGFNLSQTVELPNGVYTLSMQAMYRASYDAGTSTNCVLYAETTGKVYSTAIANYGDYTPASESLANVAALMTSSADNYANKIPYFIVTDGKANIGARSLGQLTYCNNGYWFIWNPTSLLLSDVTDEVVLGTALEEVKAEAKVILDAAEETDAKTSLQTAYDGATATSEGIVALKEAIRSYYPSLATADNPIDVSSLLINPKYEETAMMVATNNTNTSVAYPMVQPAGWLCSDNLTSGGNFQFYHVVGAGETFDGNSNSDNDGNTLYMRYAWDGLAPEMAAKQTVRLPEGNYRITVPAKKNGANITVNVKYTFAGVTETNTVTTDWTEYSKTFTVNEENRDITVELSFSREKVNVGSQQAYFGGVTLLSYGDPLAATRKLLKEEIEKLKVYKGNTPSGLWDESTGLFAKALVEAEALMTGTPEIAVVEAMIKTLQDYSAQALEMVPVYDALGNLIDLCSVYVAEASSIVSDESVRAAFTEAINAAEDGKDKAENLAAIESLRSGLEAARQTYVMQAEPTNDVTFDMTFNVANAGFASTSGWSGNPLPTLNNGVAEYFNKGFDMSQTLTGLPNGLYEVSCQGFYRMGGYAEAATARTNNSESLNAMLYANDATKPLMSIFECAQENKLYNNDASTSFGWIPDQMNGAAAYFESGYYQSGETEYNKVQVAVTEGKLTIGLKKTELVGNDWTLFDNFKVVKLRSLTSEEYAPEIEAWKVKAEALADTKPLGAAENAALHAAVDASADLTGKTAFELNDLIGDLQKAIAAVEPWREAYAAAKTPLVASLERFENDYNDGANGALRPMSTAAWNTLLEAVKTAAAAKDVTDSYEEFAGAAETFNAAMDAAEPSIRLYAGYSNLVSGLKGLGDTDLSAAVDAVDPAARESDDLIRQALTTLDGAFIAYKNKQDGGFSVTGMLGENTDFETEPTVTDARNSQVFDIPGWDNAFVSNPTDGDLQYVFRTRTTDIAEGVATANSLRLRSKWDQIETKIQISKEAYLPTGEYELSFYMKEPQTSGIIENLCYYELDGVRTEFTAGTAWERKTINLTVEKPTAFTLSFGFVRDTKSGDGHDAEIFVDDVTLSCYAQTAFARALAAAKEVEASSLAVQSAVAEYDGREAELIEAGTVDEATQVLLNSVTIAQNGEKATSLIKNADFTGETVSYPTQNGGGQVIAPAGWTLAYTISEWNDVNVDKDEGDTDVRFNFWAGSITHGELMQTVNALPNGVYCLSANLTTDISDGSSWVAIYGAPLNGEVGRSENVTQSASALTYDNHKVYFKVVDHAATVGVRTDAHYFKIKNVALEYVAPLTTDDAAVLTALDNGRLYQHVFVCRNNAEVDLTGFTNASGASVCLDRKNALIKAASAAQVTNEKNVIVDGVCGQFELTDKEPFALSTAFTAANATYTREMTNTWGTLVLPYAVASDDTHTYYRLTGTRTVDAETSYMSFESVDELPANTPCAFRYKGEGTTVAFTATDAKVAVPEGDKVSGTTDLPGWTSEGYYAQVKMTDAAELAKTYYISNNMFMNATASLTVAPFRATYVDASTSGVNRFLIDFSDEVTGMSDMPSTASLSVFGERGALRLVAGHAVRYSVHTLGGMLVEQGVLQDGGERSLSLPCGIYIVNGLKVQVK